MDIKEIALKVADSLRNKVDGVSHMQSNQGLVRFAEALVAELAKQNGPVLYAEFAEDGGWLGVASEYQDYLEEPHELYTSNQVAAAILKATKPLEEVKEALGEYLCSADDSPSAVRRLVSAYQERNNSAAKYCSQLNEQDAELEQLRSQLAAAQEEWNQCSGLLDDAHRSIEMLEDQLAKAEQRVAEACAELQFERSVNRHGYDKYEDADAIRSGEWRKFLKGD